MSKARHSSINKRYGKHHSHGKQYIRTYLPYLPAIAIMITSILLSGIRLPSKPGVLAYATNISSDSLLSATNFQRTSNKRAVLTYNIQLSKAAQAKANDMVARNYWSHITPDGNEPWIFVDQTGYKYQKAGENLAYGFMDSNSTVNGWMNSSSHRANLLDESFSEVGFGFSNSPNFQSDGPETVVVAMYGKPQSQANSNIQSSITSAPNFKSKLTNITKVNPNEQTTNTNSSSRANEVNTNIAKIQVLTRGQMPWALFAIGVISGIAVSILLVNHSLRLKKLIKRGESFVFHHPVLDATMFSIVILCMVLSQSAGIIR